MRLTPSRLLFATVVASSLIFFFLVSHLFFKERGYDILPDRPAAPAARPSPPQVSFGETCSPFLSGAMDDVTIIIKLGAPEVAYKLPAYLKRLTPCKPNLLLFSDRKDSIGDLEIVDALANLRPEYKHNNPDFDIYEEIQRSNETPEKGIEGWRLDKYKFLPMMELTANQTPDAAWFVFIELDTYVNWDNLYRFLSRFDSRKAHYFGSPVWPKKKKQPAYAHGGSGFVLSHGALRKMVARGRMFAENHISPGTHLFGKDVSKECCGDEVLARVLKECGVKLRGYSPMFNEERPPLIAFGHDHWCEAILGLHHMDEHDFEALHHWETTRPNPKKPLTYEDLFAYMEISMSDQKEDWTNLSEDIVFKRSDAASASFDACFKACLKDSRCVQCEHFENTCRHSHVIRLGHRQLRDGNKRWISGWVMDRVQSWKASQPPCQGAHIVHPIP
ncbi:hypothetical protein EJ04DRAFT_464611 [Polyplosphaeria fusca]|uniref:N-acetylgalactosaminide beta-1,3-galactosyltransferase n=1 Tax=Polyplosphaeria fusca TaxID=682080 RepID=A0A9P4R206_9PLEO|nr:hypothetical protein EJ04DRAFT_464611 [Polyplosphaeria fusca]